MKNIISKRQLPAIIHLYLIGLFISSLCSTATVFALESITPLSNDVPYQSAFEDYSAMSNDTLTDWKCINQSAGNNSEQCSQKNQGMQHEIIKQDQHGTDLHDTFQGGSHAHP